MLGAGRDGPGAGQVLTLEPFDRRRCEHAGQVRVFAEALGDAPPAGIARDVDHRREGPVDPGGGGFQRRHPGAAPHQIGVEGRRQSQRNGQHRLEAVDDVAADQQRDAEPALLHRDALHLVDDVDVDLVEDRSDPAALDRLSEVVGELTARSVDLRHLADLLGHGHLLEQGSHAGLDVGLRCTECPGGQHESKEPIEPKER